MEKLLGQLAGNQAILVYVYDITNSSDPLIMYGHQNQDEDMSMMHESKLDFGDPVRRHKMICRYGHIVICQQLETLSTIGGLIKLMLY